MGDRGRQATSDIACKDTAKITWCSGRCTADASDAMTPMKECGSNPRNGECRRRASRKPSAKD